MPGQARLLRTALAGALAVATLLPASNALAASRTERALVGALVGAAAGAVASKGDTKTTVAGAAAGALVGVATARDRYDRYGSRNRYRDAQYSTYGRHGQSGYGRYDTGYDSRYDSRYGSAYETSYDPYRGR